MLGVCPPGWVPYRDDLCFYLSTAPALSWNEAHVFCQDQKAQLVVIKDYKKQVQESGLSMWLWSRRWVSSGSGLWRGHLPLVLSTFLLSLLSPASIWDTRLQMFLTDLAEGATGRAHHYWIGLAWQETRGLLAWVDGTPISQSWYR